MVILGIAFLLFGGKKLPEIGAGLGRGISSFKKGLREADPEVTATKQLAEVKKEIEEVKELGKGVSA
jgi:sec-independent protein translocase protein TatA